MQAYSACVPFTVQPTTSFAPAPAAYSLLGLLCSAGAPSTAGGRARGCAAWAWVRAQWWCV